MNSMTDCGLRNAEWQKRGRIRDYFNPQSAIRIPKLKGFTLLEVLIAVAIMAGILTVIYMSFFTVSRNIEQAETTRDMADLARTLMTRMSDEVANAYVNTSMNSPVVLTVFYGKKVAEGNGEDAKRHDELSLTTLTNSPRLNTKETDLWEVGYFFRQKPDGSGWVLYRREKRLLSPDTPALEGGDEYELTDRVDHLRLRYSTGTDWSEEWDSKTRRNTPKEFEINLVLTDGSAYTTHVEVGR